MKRVPWDSPCIWAGSATRRFRRQGRAGRAPRRQDSGARIAAAGCRTEFNPIDFVTRNAGAGKVTVGADRRARGHAGRSSLFAGFAGNTQRVSRKTHWLHGMHSYFKRE
jgi:hypothetical protein